MASHITGPALLAALQEKAGDGLIIHLTDDDLWEVAERLRDQYGREAFMELTVGLAQIVSGPIPPRAPTPTQPRCTHEASDPFGFVQEGRGITMEALHAMRPDTLAAMEADMRAKGLRYRDVDGSNVLEFERVVRLPEGP